MIALSLLFVVYVIVSVLYIRGLHIRIRAHEAAWKQIETLTDQNKDGDVVVHCRHIE